MRRSILLVLLALSALVSCQKQEYVVYDHPYVYVVWADDNTMAETSSIISRANNAVRNYTVTLSSKRREDPVSVNYEIVHGDGLEPGVDYEVEAESGVVTFEPGTYTGTISIKFLRHTVKKDLDNSVAIRLTGASVEGVTLGLPGAVPRNASHTIKKVN